MEYVKININDYIKVKLTNRGKDIYYRQYDEINKKAGKILIEPEYPKADSDGYSHFQIWELMKLYGSHLSLLSTELPFETNLQIEIK